jgi:EmrB/QacA subfamily drug resistance transporter
LKAETNNKNVALAASSLGVLFVTVTGSSLNVALPSIGKEFGSDAILLGWVVTIFVLAAAVFSIPFGRIADIVGLKKIFLYGTIIFSLASLAAIFSNSTEILIVWRAVQGLAAAMIAVNSIALVTAVFPPEERGRALGINIASVYLGSSVGPFVGGLLTQHIGWRSIFAVNIPVCLLVAFLILWKVKGEWSACKGEKFDYIGSLIFGFALIALMYGFSILPGVTGGLLVAGGIIGLAAFLFWENRTKSPVLNIKIFKNNHVFILSNLAALISYTSIFAISFLISLYLQYIKALTPAQAGFVLVVQPLAQTVLSPLAGKLSDKVEPRILASVGMALIFLGLAAFAFLSNGTSIITIILILIVLGVGFALFSSPNSNAVMSSVVPKYLGVASAVMSTMRGVGQMLSMGITLIIMAVVIGRVVITPDYYQVFLNSTRIAFAAFACLCLVGVFTSLSRGKVR